MTSEPILEPEESPQICDKTPYPNKKAARTKMNQIMKGRRKNRPKMLRCYVCERCGMFHLTSKEDRFE